MLGQLNALPCCSVGRGLKLIIHWDHKNSCPYCDQVKDLSQLKHRFEANTHYDVKLKKLACRIKNIYDLDCYPRQKESDQRVKSNSTTWTTVLLLDRTTVLLLYY